VEKNHITNALLIQHGGEQSREAESKASMRRTAVLEKVEIKLNRFETHSLFVCLLNQDVVPVFPLCACGNFHPFPKQIKTFGFCRFIFLLHVVEGADFYRIVSDENEFMSKFLAGIFT
jgi:hypothetical protein